MLTYQPFIYIIGWSELNAWYIGSRYAKQCSLSDLFTIYETSSKLVAELRSDFGEPDFVEVYPMPDRATALAIETETIRQFGLAKSDRWLNRSNNYWATPSSEPKPRIAKRSIIRTTCDKAEVLRKFDNHRFAAPREQKRDMLRQILISDDSHTAAAKQIGMSVEAIRRFRYQFGWTLPVIEKESIFPRYSFRGGNHSVRAIGKALGKPDNWVKKRINSKGEFDEEWTDGRLRSRTPAERANVSAKNKAFYHNRTAEHFAVAHYRKHEFNGSLHTMLELEALTGIPQKLISSRLRRGLTLEQALARPYRPRNG